MSDSFSFLGRRTMEMYLADWYAKIFPDYQKAYKKELARLRALSDEEYSQHIKLAKAVSKWPCPECGCEFNGNHDEQKN